MRNQTFFSISLKSLFGTLARLSQMLRMVSESQTTESFNINTGYWKFDWIVISKKSFIVPLLFFFSNNSVDIFGCKNEPLHFSPYIYKIYRIWVFHNYCVTDCTIFPIFAFFFSTFKDYDRFVLGVSPNYNFFLIILKITLLKLMIQAWFPAYPILNVIYRSWSRMFFLRKGHYHFGIVCELSFKLCNNFACWAGPYQLRKLRKMWQEKFGLSIHH